MEQRTALVLLDEVQQVRRRAQARVGGLWFPLLVFGALSMASTPLHGPALGTFWAVASPVALGLTALFYSRRERAIGIESRLGPIVLAIAVILVGTGTTGSLGGILGAEMVAAAGPTLATSVGLAMFARIAHSEALAGLALAMATAAVALVIAGPAPAVVAAVLAAGTGVASVLVGLALLWWERR